MICSLFSAVVPSWEDWQIVLYVCIWSLSLKLRIDFIGTRTRPVNSKKTSGVCVYKRSSRDSVVIIVTWLQAGPPTGDFSPLRSVRTDPVAHVDFPSVGTTRGSLHGARSWPRPSGSEFKNVWNCAFIPHLPLRRAQGRLYIPVKTSGSCTETFSIKKFCILPT